VANRVTAKSASVVKIGRKKCKPFILEVMVFAPEEGIHTGMQT